VAADERAEEGPSVARLSREPVYTRGDPRTLKTLDAARNARYMTKSQMARLVQNIRTDGYLTSTPLVWHDVETGDRIVLSGNHRVMASVEVGLTEIGWLETDDPLPRQRRLAIQLSHNAIDGQDDPAVLKDLFEELEDIEWRGFAGLDDKTLDLLEKVSPEAMSEAPLDFATVQIIFLPAEVENAQRAFDSALEMSRADHVWVAREEEFRTLLNSLDVSRAASGVTNTAVALGYILDVFDSHQTDMVMAWYDDDLAQPRDDKRWVPVQTVFGIGMPAPAAALVLQAVRRAVEKQDVNPRHPWQWLEQVAAEYLAGA
jgi:hypothetical protein